MRHIFDHVPQDYAEARALAYWSAQTGRPWARSFVLYAGQGVGQGYDSILFVPEAIVTIWDTQNEKKPLE